MEFFMLYIYPIFTHFSTTEEGEQLLTIFLIMFNLYICM